MNDITPPQPPKPTQPVFAAQNNVPSSTIGKPVRSKRGHKFLIAVLALGILGGILAGAWYYVRANTSIKIGDITITKHDLDVHTATLQDYFDTDKNLKPKGKTRDIAISDLIENAAFRKELKDKGETKILRSIETSVTGSQKANSTQTAAFKKMYQIRAENTAFKQALGTKLLARESLLMATVDYDSPYYEGKSTEEVTAAYTQSKEILAQKLLPAMKSGTVASEVAKLADVNLLDADKTDDQNSDQYSKKLISRVAYIPDFDPAHSLFNDLDRTKYNGVDLDVKSTPGEIAKLKNVGDTTDIFASKAGAFMVIRLEHKSGGPYASWNDFVQKYKDTYDKGDLFGLQKLVYRVGKQLSKSVDIAVSNSPLKTSVALADPSYCSESGHVATVSIVATDNTSGTAVEVSGGSWTYGSNRAGRVKCPNNGGVFNLSGSFRGSFSDNCWEDSPSFSIDSNPTPPSGYKWVSVNTTNSGWAGGNVNTYGGYQIFVAYTKERIVVTPPPPPPPGQISCDITPSSLNIRNGTSGTLTVNAYGAGAHVVYIKNMDTGSTANGGGTSYSFGVSPADNKTTQYIGVVQRDSPAALATCGASVTKSSSPPPPPPPPPVDYYFPPYCFISTPGSTTVEPNSAFTIDWQVQVRNDANINTLEIREVDGSYLNNPVGTGSTTVSYPTYGNFWSTQSGSVSMQAPSTDNTDFYIYGLMEASDPSNNDGKHMGYCGIKMKTRASITARAQYGPWLQSKRGNVTAFGNIDAQPAGSPGSRPAGASELEAQYVVMAYAVNNFCSTQGYDFGSSGGGGKGGSTCVYARDGYRNSAVNTFTPTKITDALAATPIGSPAGAADCTLAKPYAAGVAMPSASGPLPISFQATAACPVLTRVTGNYTLNASTLKQGRGTLYVAGDLTITGDIIEDYSGTFNSVNEIPNLGIVVKGDIIINANVARVDASLYASGKIKTCSAYPDATNASHPCNNTLTINGKLAAGLGFNLGRTKFDTPAELVIGSGLVDAFPPPGFEDISSTAAKGVRSLSTDANPRF